MTAAASKAKTAIAPVTAAVDVPVPPAKAFELFTQHMSDWWPVEYAMVPKPRKIVVEPKKGGRWYEKGADGSERLVATVVAWKPGDRVTFDWHIDAAWQSNPTLATGVEINFTPTSKGTHIALEHRDLDRFGDQAEATRNGLAGKGGWPDLLSGFAAFAAKTRKG